MEKLEFRVTFHTAYAVNQQSMVPGSVLKGLMLDAARDLGLTSPLLWPKVRAVFGGFARENELAGPTLPSPWAWSDLQFEQEASLRNRSRIRVDANTGTVADGAIVQVNEFGGQSLSGVFTVEQIGQVPQLGDSSDLTVKDHLVILEATARTVTGLGGSRRRGLGWVSVTRTDDGTDSAGRIKNLASEFKKLCQTNGGRI